MPTGAGTLIGGRFRLLGPLGQGGMGRVWRGRDELLDRDVAVKEVLLPPEVPEGVRTELIARTIREAKSAGRLNHPGIVTIHDVIEHGRVPWIVMEYVPGASLGSVLKKEGRLPLQRAGAIGAKVADALAHAHACGIVHRDLKPDNILIWGDRVVITDFGIARILDATSRMTSSGTIMGTPSFMAPEQLDGRQAGPAADVWSLGATLYLVIEGRLPFEGPTLTALITAILTRDLTVPRQAGRLTGLLVQLLTKDPAGRPTAAALAAILGGGVGASPAGPAGPYVPPAGLPAGSPSLPPVVRAREPWPPTGTISPRSPTPVANPAPVNTGTRARARYVVVRRPSLFHRVAVPTLGTLPGALVVFIAFGTVLYSVFHIGMRSSTIAGVVIAAAICGPLTFMHLRK
jgi:serine/threonine protein kinase